MDYKETLDSELTQQRFQKLESENKNLKQQVEDIKFEYEIKFAISNNSYAYNHIMHSEEFKSKRHILALGGYYTEFLIDLVDKYGYEKVNNHLLERLDEHKQSEMSDEGV